MKEIIELKPCPFCGSHDVGYHGGIDDGHDHYRIICFNCWAATSEKLTKAKATKAWNRRNNNA